MKWQVVQNEENDGSFNSVHVYPKADDKEHIITEKCHCQPSIEKYTNSQIVIHNAYDGRI